MRFATLFLTVLALAPALTVAAPVPPEHFEELEARWNPFSSKGFKNFVHNVKLQSRTYLAYNSDYLKQAEKVYKKVAPVAKKLAPVAKTLAPLILKREDEMEEHLHRRHLPETPTSPAFPPTVAKHAYEKRGEYGHLDAMD